MELAQAKKIAEKYVEQLKPYCKIIAIGGSIRREQPFVKDIEIVAVRDIKKILELKDLVETWHKVKGEPIGKYTQRVLPEGIKLDLFFADERNFGLIFLIRTGNWKYSKWMMGSKAREKGFIVDRGYLWSKGVIVDVPSEEVFYSLMQMPFVEPKLREY